MPGLLTQADVPTEKRRYSDYSMLLHRESKQLTRQALPIQAVIRNVTSGCIFVCNNCSTNKRHKLARPATSETKKCEDPGDSCLYEWGTLRQGARIDCAGQWERQMDPDLTDSILLTDAASERLQRTAV
jgi:hypothetical protein